MGGGMELADFRFERPVDLQATLPPEARGLARDGVRLLVSRGREHVHAGFVDLADFLDPGDLLVVNDSATLPASLPATGPDGTFLLNASTDYGRNLWLVEPRHGPGEPGPIGLNPGDEIRVPGIAGRVVAHYPEIPRLSFVRFDGDLREAMEAAGEPIRYGYLAEPQPLDAYQTPFAARPGSAEMPSAARPFTERVVERLRAKGVGIASITLHAGVSSLEVEFDALECGCEDDWNPLYGEPFEVPAATARAVTAAKRDGRRVVAVGTTVVRALESAYDGAIGAARPVRGFTRAFITPKRGVAVPDGLLTGMHDPETTHLAMLHAIAGAEVIGEAYRAAVGEGYLWHEFGDSHLILPGSAR